MKPARKLEGVQWEVKTEKRSDLIGISTFLRSKWSQRAGIRLIAGCFGAWAQGKRRYKDERDSPKYLDGVFARHGITFVVMEKSLITMKRDSAIYD